MDIQNQLLKIADNYTQQLLGEFKELAQVETPQVNFYISGSVSYGYCDELSDIEMEIWFPSSASDSHKQIMQDLIDKYKEFEGIRISAGISDWPLELIVGNTEQYWTEFNPYQLYELSTAISTYEPIKLIDKVKNIIKFYPQNIFIKSIKGLWLVLNDSGSYNSEWTRKRNQIASSNILYFKALESMLRLIYILNNKYYPHTKWLEKGVINLHNNFGIVELVTNIEKLDIAEKILFFEKVKNNIAEFMVGNDILDKSYIDNPWKILQQDYYIYFTF